MTAKYDNVLHVNGGVQRKIHEILPRFLPVYAVGLIPLTLKFNNSIIFNSSYSMGFF